MAEEKPFTPEKQLLRLIEDSKAKDTKTVSSSKIGRRARGFFSLGAWLGNIFSFNNKFRKAFKGNESPLFRVKAINSILFFLICVLIFYFVQEFFNSINDFKRKGLSNIEVEENNQIKGFSEKAVTLKSLDYYLERIDQRDIFKMGVKEENVKPAGIENTGPLMPTPSERLREATKSLRVVGIGWSENPDVLIEDTEVLRTFFVKEGQMINKFEVEKIFKDRVILSYDGESIELK